MATTVRFIQPPATPHSLVVVVTLVMIMALDQCQSFQESGPVRDRDSGMASAVSSISHTPPLVPFSSNSRPEDDNGRTDFPTAAAAASAHRIGSNHHSKASPSRAAPPIIGYPTAKTAAVNLTPNKNYKNKKESDATTVYVGNKSPPRASPTSGYPTAVVNTTPNNYNDSSDTPDTTTPSGATPTTGYPTTINTTPNNNKDVNTTVVVVNCSSSIPQVLPVPVPTAGQGGNSTVPGMVVEVVVAFDDGWSGDVNCSWVIPAYNNDSSNSILFQVPPRAEPNHHHNNDSTSWLCNPHHQHDNNTNNLYHNNTTNNTSSLTLYNLDPSSGHATPILDACLRDPRLPAVSGQPGSPTLVRLTATESDVPGDAGGARNWTVLSYTAFDWGSQLTLCRGSPAAATLDRKVLEVPDSHHRFPVHFGCDWEFEAPDKGVVNVRLFSHGGGNSSGAGGGGGEKEQEERYPGWRDGSAVARGNASSFFLLLVPGDPRLRDGIKIPLTEDGVDFEHSGLGGTIVLGFVSDVAGGAPPFTLTYWADGMQLLCPASPRQLEEASPTQLQAFKGVNHGLHETARDRNCSWRLSAPSGMVVKLEKLYNIDYLIYMNTLDTLSLGTGQTWGKTIPLDKNQAFPFWSQGSSLAVGFHGDAATRRSQFTITYRAVPAGACQGHPVKLTATGQRFQVTVTLHRQPNLCQHTWTSPSAITAYYNDQPDFRYLLPPVCSPYPSPTPTPTPTSTTTTTLTSSSQPSNDSWIYTSRPGSDVILVVFDRDPGTSYVTSGLTVTYGALPVATTTEGPTSGGGEAMRASLVTSTFSGMVAVLMVFSR